MAECILGKRNKRIALLINSLSGGGAERVTCNLANYFYEKGYSVDVITLTNKNDTYELDDGVERVCLLDDKERSNKVKNLIIEWKRLKQYVLQNSDIPCYITMLPLNAFFLTRLKRHINGKIILSERNDPTTYNHINSFLMKSAVKKCDGLVVQTGEISKYYSRIQNRVVIPNAINKDIVLHDSERTEKKIVAVGRLRKQKNYPMIIEAFRRFHESHPDYHLEIYGQGCEENNLKLIVEKSGLANKVFFRGYVKNISEKISSAACFVMASNYEGMSNSLIEAMCLGIPCVVTDCDGGGARELINNMKNGILVKKNAVDEMVLGMNKVIDDKKFRKMISNNAKKMRDELDPDKIYGKWLEYIKSICSQEGAKE